MRKIRIISMLVLAVMVLAGCVDKKSRATGVYMLMDTSGTYTEELNKAQAIINYLLGTLDPGDSIAVARIDSGSFSEKDIIARMTFDHRPSVSNKQRLVKNVKGSPYTDISGGMLQAIEYLNEAAPGRKYILIFSDLKEDLPEGYVRDVPFELRGFNVVALNVTKLHADNVNPRDYLERLSEWQHKVEDGSGQWKVINDLERLDKILD
jgi:hypothetical protein